MKSWPIFVAVAAIMFVVAALLFYSAAQGSDQPRCVESKPVPQLGTAIQCEAP